MTTIAEYYRRVDAAWPQSIPTLTAPEAIKAARKLYRWAFGAPWRGPVTDTSGNRYSYISGGVMRVNAERGWKDFIHEFSHYIHHKMRRDGVADEKPHSREHARIELNMVKLVVRRGWLLGALRAPAPVNLPPEITQQQEREKLLAALDKKIKLWTSRTIRADNKRRHYKRRRAAQIRAWARKDAAS